MNENLIVALDVPTIRQARRLVTQLDGVISFFKIGMWLMHARGAENLIDDLKKAGKKVFLDAKMYDIGQTVEEGVKHVADRGIDILTIHGDPRIIDAAVKGCGNSELKVFAISVLTSLDDAALKEMGYALTTKELIHKKVKQASDCGCDGVIAAGSDNPDLLRTIANNPNLLIGTPGIRSSDDPKQDHARTATAREAILNGANYLIIGRPIISHNDPLERAKKFINEMEIASKLRYNTL